MNFSRLKKLSLLFAVGVVSIGLSFVLTGLAKATTPSWTVNPPSLVTKEDAVGNWQNPCQARFQSIKMEVTVNANNSPAKTDCFLGEHAGVKLFTYDSSRTIAVQFPGDKLAYPVRVNCLSCVYLESKDTLIMVDSQNDIRSGRVVIYKNFLKRLQFVDNVIPSEHYYSFDKSSPELISNFYQEPGYQGYIKHLQRSDNDKWLVVEYVGKGLVRINLDTMEMLKFSDWHTDYWHAGPFIEYDITDDGQYIAVFGQNTQNTIYDITSGCGAQVAQTSTEDEIAQNQPVRCPVTEMAAPNGNEANNTYMPHLRATYQPQFSDDGGEITFYATSYDSIPPRKITLRAHGYTPPARLEYLALGDSYSSGEGDTEINPATGKKYYRYGTDIEENKSAGQPREKCHVSTRSYPYLLAQGMDLALDSPKQWDSVACSGALSRDVIPEDKITDRGQDSRLAGFSNYQDLKATALNEMIPGRLKQIEFVNTYKPKVITLTMGGNDIDFSGKIYNCVISPATCGFVNSDRASLAAEIRGQYDDLKKLYEKIYDASGSKTKIYVLGYPQFINGNAAASCESNIAALNANEREMIQESITYINNVIKKAAKAAGVKYIDIENSLSGHRLCDDDKKYVTGVADPANLSSNRQESFHPNAKGHFEMAMSVWDKVDHESLIDYDICPDVGENICKDPSATKESIEVPEYFQGLDSDKNVHHKQMTTFDQIVNTTMDLGVGTYELAGNLVTTIIAHSDPTDLGQFMTNSDGSLSVKVPIPSTVPVGYHTLILSGKTYSGEPIEYEQTILIKGSNPSDVDNDGVTDSEDKCLFIAPVNMDIDQDSIDDACDPEISDPPVLPQDPYRIRAGNPTKSYAGIAEASNALYLERNLHASGKTGVVGDYDPDQDGWVVIATNQSGTTSAVPATPPLTQYTRFWLEDVTNTGNLMTKLPHVSFRTPNNGCVQYKPADLSKVTESNVGTRRIFMLEAQDTNTCRVEPIEADADNNSLPDNIQPLYRARNGNPALSHVKPNGARFFEDVKQLYLERSTRAAEAQLGKSDYAAKETGALTISPTDARDYRENWSVIGISNNPVYLPTPIYKKLQIFNNQLFVLASTSTSPFFTQCSAYKPQNLATIGQVSQYTRLLQLDFMQTLSVQVGGCNG